MSEKHHDPDFALAGAFGGSDEDCLGDLPSQIASEQARAFAGSVDSGRIEKNPVVYDKGPESKDPWDYDYACVIQDSNYASEKNFARQYACTSRNSPENEARNMERGTISDPVLLPGSMIQFFKDQKLHRKKPIFRGMKSTACDPISLVVKLIHYSEEALEEAKSLHTVDQHPNVVKIYDSGIYDENIRFVYLAMELCSQETLYDYVSRCNSLNLNQSIQHSFQIISGLAFIHEKGIAHRNLNPYNILFSASRGHERVKISNFGMSKRCETREVATTLPSVVMQKMGYMAPEQIRCEKQDATKCDAFSLGVLIAFIQSNGKHPYGEHGYQWASKIAEGSAPNLSIINLPSSSQTKNVLCVIKKMLQDDPLIRPVIQDVMSEWSKRVVDFVEEPDSTPLHQDLCLMDDPNEPLQSMSFFHKSATEGSNFDVFDNLNSHDMSEQLSVPFEPVRSMNFFHADRPELGSEISEGLSDITLPSHHQELPKLMDESNKESSEETEEAVDQEDVEDTVSLAIATSSEFRSTGPGMDSDVNEYVVMMTMDELLRDSVPGPVAIEQRQIDNRTSGPDHYETCTTERKDALESGMSSISEMSEGLSDITLPSHQQELPKLMDESNEESSEKTEEAVNQGDVEDTVSLAIATTSEYRSIDSGMNSGLNADVVTTMDQGLGDSVPGPVAIEQRQIDSGTSDLNGELGETMDHESVEDSVSGAITALDTIKLGGGRFELDRNPIKHGYQVLRGRQKYGSQYRRIIGKILQPRFQSEIDILLTLEQHSNVVQTYDCVDYIDGISKCLILEECHKDTLDDIMEDKSKQLDLKSMWKYTRHLVDGMKFIHGKRICHGDLKPGNILFSRDMQCLKIGDFGLSKELKNGISKTTTSKPGSEGWRAPETYKKCMIGFKPDIYCLALVLYFLWTNGLHPFGEIYDRTSNIVSNKRRDLSQLLMHDDEPKNKQLQELLKCMLDYDPDCRPTMEKIDEHEFLSGVAPKQNSEIFQEELSENKSAPISKAFYVKDYKLEEDGKTEETEVSLMGCKAKFAKDSFKKTGIVYFGVKPISDFVPKEQIVISLQVECEIFISSRKCHATFLLPLHALPSEKCQVWVNFDGDDWKVLGEPLLEGRIAKFETPAFKSVKVIVTCSQIQATFLRHLVYNKQRELCGVVCLDNDALVSRLSDIIEAHNFAKLSGHFLDVKLEREQKYNYKFNSRNASLCLDKEIILEQSGFVRSPAYFESIFMRLPKDDENENPRLYISMSLPKEEKKELNLKEPVDSQKSSLPRGYIRCSTKEFYNENSRVEGNCCVQPDRLKGMILIVNNEFMKKEGNNEKYREGSRNDMVSQVALWKDLGFNVTAEINLSAEKMKIACQKFAADAKKRHAGIVVVIIMTHGGTKEEKQIFFGEDGNTISLDEVISIFVETGSSLNHDQIVEWREIPKVFMFQACRNKTNASTAKCGSPAVPNMLIAYPCQFGKKSSRKWKTGSRIMNAIAEVFKQHAHNTHVLDMFTKVNNEVSASGGGKFQVVTSESTLLTENLYLFPGWPDKP